MVIGEVAVYLAKQRRHRAAQGFNYGRRDAASYAIAAIDYHIEWPVELANRQHLLGVGGDDIRVRGLAFAAAQGIVLQVLQQRLDTFFRQGNAANHHFQAIVLRRVVAAGDHNAGAGLQLVSCKVQQRRRHQTYANHIHTTLTQTTT